MTGAPRVISQQTQQQVLPSVWHTTSKNTGTVKVDGLNVIIFDNSSSQLITTFSGGQPNQRILLVGDGNTTIQANANILTSDGLNKLLGVSDTTEFIKLPTGPWLELTQGTGGGGGGGVSQDYFVNVVWGTPAAESSNAIEVLGSCEYLDGSTYTTGLAAIRVIVSDGAVDREPSATATINEANTPVGTLLAGGGTATAEFLTDSNGQFRIQVTETAAADRYIWVQAGGHFQLFVKAKLGVLQLTFT